MELLGLLDQVIFILILGKSSLFSALQGFYDIHTGRIEINGIQMQKFSKSYLRQQIRAIYQDADLFEGSIKYNIMYNNQACTFDDVKSASSAARVTDFVETDAGKILINLRIR